MNEISTNALNETISALSREVILPLFVQIAKVSNWNPNPENRKIYHVNYK